MEGVLMFLFVLVCIMLLIIILLQSGKSGGMGGAISGQSMNDAFGGDGADKLMVRLTRILAFAFMILAIGIGQMGLGEEDSVLDPSALEKDSTPPDSSGTR